MQIYEDQNSDILLRACKVICQFLFNSSPMRLASPISMGPHLKASLASSRVGTSRAPLLFCCWITAFQKPWASILFTWPSCCLLHAFFPVINRNHISHLDSVCLHIFNQNRSVCTGPDARWHLHSKECLGDTEDKMLLPFMRKPQAGFREEMGTNIIQTRTLPKLIYTKT